MTDRTERATSAVHPQPATAPRVEAGKRVKRGTPAEIGAAKATLGCSIVVWSKFEDALPRDGAFILVGHPERGTLLKVLQLHDSRLFMARCHQAWQSEDVYCPLSSARGLFPLWSYLPVVAAI